MSEINGISSNLIQSYVTIKSKPDLTLEDMFRMLSFALGGDGTSITKEQLDDYIDKADSGDLNVNNSRLKALRKMQGNWNTIAGDDDRISFEDMKAFPMLLISATFSGISSDSSDPETTDAEVGSYLLENILNNSDEDEKKDETARLSTMLNKALSGNSDKNDDSNADLIAVLTNLIAQKTSLSTIETDA